MIAARQKSKKTPRTFGDWREMLKQEQFDIVHIATPDHWHALPMIAACKAGADVYVEKPVSVDVVEAQAMLAAARKYNRVVQVNMQRRSTPHLIEAKERVIQAGQAGQDRLRRDLLLLPHAGPRQPRRHDAAGVSGLRDVDRSGPDAAVLPDQSPPRLAGFHGVRQRHHRRYVRAHARHGPLAARPGHADADQLRRRHPRGQEQQGQHHATRRLAIVRLSAICPSSGPIGRGAARRTRTSRGPGSSTATRARSRPTCTSTSSSRRARARRSKARPCTSTTSTPRTRPRRTWSATCAAPMRRHWRNFLDCGRFPQPAGLQHRAGGHHRDRVHPGQHVLQARAQPDLGSGRRARSSATKKRTGSSRGRIAARGCTRTRRQSEQD